MGREPGTTPAGEGIRKILQDPNLPDLNSRTEMLLYVAAGIEFFEDIVKPSLINGEIFITDRWRYSTKAYQGYGLGIDLGVIDSLIKFSCDSSYPDITFLLDVDPKIGLSKITGNEFSGSSKDKIEKRALEYHQRVREGYLETANQNPERFRIIPYVEGKPEEMHKMIVEKVEDYIRENNLENVLLKQ